MDVLIKIPWLLPLALLPAAILLWYVHRKDVIDPERPSRVAILLLLGCAVAVPAVLIEMGGGFFLQDMAKQAPVAYELADSFLLAALAEEGAKFAFLCTQWRSRAFKTTYDGIVFSVCISLGFAALENIIYAFAFGLGTVLMRAFTAITVHLSCGVLMGVGFGLAREAYAYRKLGIIDKPEIVKMKNRFSYKINLLLAFIVPWFVHGAYDTLVGINRITLGIGVALELLVFVWALLEVRSQSWYDRAIPQGLESIGYATYRSVIDPRQFSEYDRQMIVNRYIEQQQLFRMSNDYQSICDDDEDDTGNEYKREFRLSEEIFPGRMRRIN